MKTWVSNFSIIISLSYYSSCQIVSSQQEEQYKYVTNSIFFFVRDTSWRCGNGVFFSVFISFFVFVRVFFAFLVYLFVCCCCGYVFVNSTIIPVLKKFLHRRIENPPKTSRSNLLDPFFFHPFLKIKKSIFFYLCFYIIVFVFFCLYFYLCFFLFVCTFSCFFSFFFKCLLNVTTGLVRHR